MSAAPAPLDPGPEAFLASLDPHRAAFERYRGLLADWNGRMNLVGASTLDDFWTRHLVDCAQLRWFEPKARVWADLGSGAGLPGVVLAILLKGTPGARVHLVESMAKRCRFLTAIAAELDLPVEIHNARAEALDLAVEVVTARACAPLARLLGYARPYFERGARGAFLKGQDADAEIAEARRAWRFAARTAPSLSDARGRVLFVEGLARA